MYLKWPGISADSTLVIDVDKSEFGIQPGPLELAGKVFQPKQETHITLFGSTTGISLLRQIKHNPVAEQQIRRVFESTDWSYNKTVDYRHLISERNNRCSDTAIEESIIMLVEMQGMAKFYEELKTLDLIESDWPVPPAHVTLYTHNCDRGIGIHSDSELAELTYEHLQRPG